LVPDTSARGLLITISGPAGSGKSHCAMALAKYLSFPHYSAGSIFRNLATERGLSLEALAELAEGDASIDRAIDSRSQELAEKGGAILEGRMVAFFSSTQALKLSFYLTASFEERIRRIAEREGISIIDAKAKTLAREESENRRYREFYGLDPHDLSQYDFVINTHLWDKEGIVALLKGIIKTYLKQVSRKI